MALSWVDTVVLRILSWAKVGYLGCFVDSMLQTRNSSNRWVEVFFLGCIVSAGDNDGSNTAQSNSGGSVSDEMLWSGH